MSGAMFEGQTWRCSLWRGECGQGPVWVMLNPSTAGITDDDPTIRSVRRISARQGFDSFLVVNRAWRERRLPPASTAWR